MDCNGNQGQYNLHKTLLVIDDAFANLDANLNSGPCPGFCGSSMMNGFCCSKDESGTLRCPKSAKFAVTSDTNSCVTLNEIPEDDEFITDEVEVESDIDADTTMILDTPQAGFHWTLII